MFNFKITHLSNQSNIDINKYIKNISLNNFDNIDKISKLLTHYTNDGKVYQCTNLINFPDNFT